MHRSLKESKHIKKFKDAYHNLTLPKTNSMKNLYTMLPSTSNVQKIIMCEGESKCEHGPFCEELIIPTNTRPNPPRKFTKDFS
jgi:hypothetical protein